MKRSDPAKLPEGDLRRYDWARARRGRLATKAAKATALLRILDPALARRFPDSQSVNEALRALVALDEALPRRRTPQATRRVTPGTPRPADGAVCAVAGKVDGQSSARTA
jgi:hypothetical protein